MTPARIAVAVMQRLLPPRSSEVEVTLLATHMAYIRLEGRRQELPNPHAVAEAARIAKRILAGYSRVQQRKLRPDELKPNRHKVSRFYLRQYERAWVTVMEDV